MRRKLWTILGVVTLIGPAPASAQELGFLTDLFKKVHHVTLAVQGGDLTNKRDLATNDSRCDFLNVCGIAAEVLIDVTAPTNGVHLELGVGASYLRGFHEREGAPYDIRGAVRSFPTISAYVTAEAPLIEPYAGVNFGFSDLWNAQAYDAAGREYSVKAQTFDYGATLGFYRPLGRMGIFFEANYRRRRFASLDWSTDTLVNQPREFNLDALVGAIGLQFDLREEEKQPPAITGTWELVRVDGDSLPAIESQVAAGGGGNQSTRTEIVGGHLDFETHGFRVLVCRRTVSMNGDVRVGITAPACTAFLSGGYSAEGEPESVRLRPSGEIDPVPVFRVGDQITFRRGVHLYQFRKQGS